MHSPIKKSHKNMKKDKKKIRFDVIGEWKSHTCLATKSHGLPGDLPNSTWIISTRTLWSSNYTTLYKDFPNEKKIHTGRHMSTYYIPGSSINLFSFFYKKHRLWSITRNNTNTQRINFQHIPSKNPIYNWISKQLRFLNPSEKLFLAKLNVSLSAFSRFFSLESRQCNLNVICDQSFSHRSI